MYVQRNLWNVLLQGGVEPLKVQPTAQSLFWLSYVPSSCGQWQRYCALWYVLLLGRLASYSMGEWSSLYLKLGTHCPAVPNSKIARILTSFLMFVLVMCNNKIHSVVFLVVTQCCLLWNFLPFFVCSSKSKKASTFFRLASSWWQKAPPKCW